MREANATPIQSTGSERWLAAAVLALGCGLVVLRQWTCDDAFISFRYAEQLIAGHGLVFNAGEPVEGYTNFLWTLWIAAGLKLGVDPEAWAHLWSGAAFLGSVGLLLWAYPRVSDRPRSVSGVVLLPVAALAAVAHDDWTIYATGGLETSLFALLLLGGFLTLLSGLPAGRRAALAGGLLALATLTRPDGALIALVGGVYTLVVGPREDRLRSAAIYGGVFCLLWAPHQLWRMAFYGDFFPNTYYAKSASSAWWSQGLRYLALYLVKYWPLVVVPVAATLAARRAGVRWGRAVPLALAMMSVYVVYIVKVGGGFMFGRLLVPMTPFAVIVLDGTLCRLAQRHPRAYRPALAVTLLGLVLTPFPVRHQEIRWGIANERAFYGGGAAEKTDAEARILARFFDGLPVRLAFLGGEARLVFRTRVPTGIECETGLTDRVIAHQTLARRGRIGHEKHAPIEYVIGERRAHFAFHPFVTNVLPLDDAIPDYRIDLDGVSGRILHWDPALLAELRSRGAVFQDLPADLDRYLATADERDWEVVAHDYARFRRFYFAHVSDPARERLFWRRLDRGLGKRTP